MHVVTNKHVVNFFAGNSSEFRENLEEMFHERKLILSLQLSVKRIF